MYLDIRHVTISFFFFFNDTATTEIYTLSLHDALPISRREHRRHPSDGAIEVVHVLEHVHREHEVVGPVVPGGLEILGRPRSEEHTSELQSPCNLVCRLLLEKKKISLQVPTLPLRSRRV